MEQEKKDDDSDEKKMRMMRKTMKQAKFADYAVGCNEYKVYIDAPEGRTVRRQVYRQDTDEFSKKRGTYTVSEPQERI